MGARNGTENVALREVVRIVKYNLTLPKKINPPNT